MHEYLACVFCGKSQYLGKGRHIPFSGDIEPLEYKVYQRREQGAGPGRGHKTKHVGGFKVDKIASETIQEMLLTHPEMVANIKGRLLKIVKAYVAAEIIDPKELQI